MMEGFTALKAWLVAAILFVSEWFGTFGILSLILIILFVLDFITGIIAAIATDAKQRTDTEKKKHGIKSKIGIIGVVKKVGYMCLVVLGCLIDGFISAATDIIGFHLPIKLFFATVVVAWLILNEMVSILENLDRSGIDSPPWLLKLICGLKLNVDNAVEDEIDNIMDTESETADKETIENITPKEIE